MADGQAVTSRGIHAAISAVMKKVGVIGKDRTNPNQNYKFRGIDDVVERCGPLMAECGVVCTPRVLSYTAGFVTSANGKPMSHVHVMVEHKYSAADGSFELVTTLGEAMDTGDKACPKAMSIALKYSHTECFQIATFEKDRDTEEHSPELAPKAPAQRPASAPRAAAPSQSAAAPKSSPRPAQASSGAGVVFPPFGRSKGLPVAGAAMGDLNFYKSSCERSLADPSKSRFHAKEQALLAAIEAEIDAQTGGSQPHDNNDDEPPHTDSDAF